VRIALGETQVIAETKKALTNAGVNVASLEEYAAGKVDGVKRSNHVLLAKNLPYGWQIWGFGQNYSSSDKNVGLGMNIHAFLFLLFPPFFFIFNYIIKKLLMLKEDSIWHIIF
jgi:hypothetical protein